MKTAAKLGFLSVCYAVSGAPAVSQDMPRLGLPAACTPGSDCFLQQMPDMDAGPGVSDPYCGVATYDGHKGTDLRVRYTADTDAGVDVIAMASGTVLRVRDGMADALVRDEPSRAAVADRECGNGVVIDHGGGIEVQYCHMKQGSVSVTEGRLVEAGERLGSIGYSGLAAFPHVHVSVRRNGDLVDPFTGRGLDTGCSAGNDGKATLFDPETYRMLSGPATQLLDAGFGPGAIEADSLDHAPPPGPDSASPALVGWARLINLEKGDRIAVIVTGPSGVQFARQAVPPLERNKASYFLFAGKKGAPAPGRYSLTVEVLRGGRAVISETRTIVIG